MTRKIYFEATNCRNQCFHCYYPEISSGREMLTLNEIVEIAKDFRDSLNEPILIRILREPTLYPDLLPLLKMAECENLLEEKVEKRALFTNGEKLSEEFLKELHPLIHHIVFTLFGTKMIHDALAGRAGAYQRIETGTALAKKAGFRVTWRMLLTKGSEQDLAVLDQRAKDLKVDQMEITPHYYLAGKMRNAYENIPTSATRDMLQSQGLPIDWSGMRPEREYAKNPSILEGVEIPTLKLSMLYIDHDLNVFPLNQIEAAMCIGNCGEGKHRLFSRLKGEALMPEPVRRAMQISMTALAEKYANPYSDKMLSPQMLFEKYYWKFDL